VTKAQEAFWGVLVALRRVWSWGVGEGGSELRKKKVEKCVGTWVQGGLGC